MSNEVFNHNVYAGSTESTSDCVGLNMNFRVGPKQGQYTNSARPPREVRRGCHKSETHPVRLNLNNAGI